MPFRTLLLAPLLFVVACTTTVPPAEPQPVPPVTTLPPPTSAEPDSTSDAEPASSTARPPAPAPADADDQSAESDTGTPADSLAVDPLYVENEDALRLAFTDGLFGLYRAEMDPADAQRLDRDEIEVWLTDLALISPRAVEFARDILGPVLEQRFVVGLLLRDASQVGCASLRDVLYIPVPERFQGPERAFTGYIVQDACDLSSGDLAPFCAGGFGISDGGTACSCTCTAGESPAQPCVSC